jgi:2-polyprenyl-3-methyl-5-hydroxy-6-metoxy-1,4-benzoquinol methylase
MNFRDINKFLSSWDNCSSYELKQILVEMLNLHTFVYQQLGKLSVKYEHGTHPKHRLTRYHEFFVNNVKNNESVIDLGSGRGDVTYDVSKKTTAEVLGIELNKNNLNYAFSTYKKSNLKFVYGNIYKDVPYKHFDVVILSNILEHLSNRVELLQLVISRVTPKKVLLRVPYFEREWTVALKKELKLNYFLDNTHKIEYMLDEFETEMKNANLKIVSKMINWGEIWAVCTL